MQGFGVCMIARIWDVGLRDCNIEILLDAVCKAYGIMRLWDYGNVGLRDCVTVGLRVLCHMEER